MTNDKQRDRLVELLDDAKVEVIEHYPDGTPCMSYTKKAVDRKVIYNLADCLLANGVICPPCKVGQTVYRVVVMSTGVTRVFKKTLCPPYRCGVIVDYKPTAKRVIRSVVVTKNNFFDVVDSFGKTVFPTKEEAEAKLKEGVQG